MKETGVIRRYVGAFLDVAEKQGKVAETGEELLAFAAAFAGSDELRKLLQHPGLAAERGRVLAALFDRLSLSSTARNFLQLLVERGRIGLVGEIAAAYREAAEARAGKVRAEIATPRPLGEEQRARLAQALAKTLGREVIVEQKVDPGLLGGVVARVGSTVYDGSVVTQLRRLEKALVKEI